jgi:hypothetical protein
MKALQWMSGSSALPPRHYKYIFLILKILYVFFCIFHNSYYFEEYKFPTADHSGREV